jgi:cell division GTPase FtsZ
LGLGGDVEPDDGKIAALDFEDVRATMQREGLRSVGVRVGADAAEEVHADTRNKKCIPVKRILRYFFWA